MAAPPGHVAVLGYARPTWQEIRHRARRAAVRNAVAAGYLVFFFSMASAAFLTWLSNRLLLGLVMLLLVFVMTASATILAAIGAYRLTLDREAPKAGLCARCGYDVSASEERCPQCGKKVTHRSIRNAAIASSPES